MDKTIQSEKEWRMTLSEERRKFAPPRIAAIDGIGERGQFYITAEQPSGSKFKVVVTASFLDKKLKKLQNSKLFRIGAPILWKQSEGVIKQANTSRTMVAQNAVYYDLKAVFSEAEEAEWIAMGLF
jgi:hypothetical protein